MRFRKPSRQLVGCCFTSAAFACSSTDAAAAATGAVVAVLTGALALEHLFTNEVIK